MRASVGVGAEAERCGGLNLCRRAIALVVQDQQLSTAQADECVGMSLVITKFHFIHVRRQYFDHGTYLAAF